MSKIPSEVSFSVDYTDQLGQKHVGEFVLRPSMSARDEADAGRRRRAIMGGSVEVRNDSDMLDFAQARYQAELTVRAISAPKFWEKVMGDDLRREVVLHCGGLMDGKLEEWRKTVEELATAAQGRIAQKTAQ